MLGLSVFIKRKISQQIDRELLVGSFNLRRAQSLKLTKFGSVQTALNAVKHDNQVRAFERAMATPVNIERIRVVVIPPARKTEAA